jgi:hypothetical protein
MLLIPCGDAMVARRAARGELIGPPQPWNELAAIADHLSAPR